MPNRIILSTDAENYVPDNFLNIKQTLELLDWWVLLILPGSI